MKSYNDLGIESICFVSPRLYLYLGDNEPAGGAQRQQSMISDELANRGYCISALVADYGQKTREEYNGVELIKGVPEEISGISSIVRALYDLAGAMTSVDPDAYLVRGAPRLAMATFLISKFLRKRFVFRVANDSDVDPSYLQDRYSVLFLFLYKFVVKSSDTVIAQTEHQSSLLEKHFAVDASIVPNGYDLPAGSDTYSSERREHILWVGSSDPEKKNPDLFVELAKFLPDLDFTMISQPIAGKEEAHNELRQKASAVENVSFEGNVAPDKVHEYYKTATLLVNTSEYEGFPNTFLEAWRYETPVVSLYFDLDGLLEEKCGGILAGDTENLVTAVNELSSDTSLRVELGSAGRKYMKNNFSLTKVVDLYEEAFSKALE